MQQTFFSACHNDNAICKKSSSGGAFTALSDKWFENDNAVVYGCVLDESLNAKHARATSAKERDKMRGSKYIQSNTLGIFKSVKNDLANNCNVLFSGTPCQISALKSYLDLQNTGTSKLLTVEVICHGVASKKFFDDYIAHLEKKYKSKAVNCNFRGKTKPNKKQDMVVTFENGKSYIASTTRFDWFYTMYLRNFVLRQSCYNCKFATQNRNSDLSIADLWGSDYEGTCQSLIIVNTDKGLGLLNLCSNDMQLSEINQDPIAVPHLNSPYKKPNNYDAFWNTYLNSGYFAMQKEFGHNNFKGKLMTFAADIIYKIH
jgi:coenzyme F420-reducing hydrogenase beta subunit